MPRLHSKPVCKSYLATQGGDRDPGTRNDWFLSLAWRLRMEPNVSFVFLAKNFFLFPPFTTTYIPSAPENQLAKAIEAQTDVLASSKQINDKMAFEILAMIQSMEQKALDLGEEKQSVLKELQLSGFLSIFLFLSFFPFTNLIDLILFWAEPQETKYFSNLSKIQEKINALTNIWALLHVRQDLKRKAR